MATGWVRLPRRTVHEWFAPAPPQDLLTDAAAAALALASAGGGQAGGGGVVFWLGRSCWPHAPRLAQGLLGQRGLLARSVFVDTRAAPGEDASAPAWPLRRGRRRTGAPRPGPSRRQRQRGHLDHLVWAAELLLRSPATAAVVADGRGLSTAASRRLQLAAEAGTALALFWRRPDEQDQLSVAHHRWQVDPLPTEGPSPRFRVTALRHKAGLQPGAGVVGASGLSGPAAAATPPSDSSRQGRRPSVHTVEVRLAEGAVRVPDGRRHRPGAASPPIAATDAAAGAHRRVRFRAG